MQSINKIYLIGNFFNWHRLYNSIRDLKLHFPNVDIQVCNGVNKNTIQIQNDIAITDWIHFGKITESKILAKGESINKWHLACNLSHINVITDALENKYECILIAEDDLLLWRRANQIIDRAIEYLPPDWELLRLSRFPSPWINVIDENKYRYKWDGVWWTELYMINAKGIKNLHKHLTKWNRASFDFQLHDYKWIQQYILKYSLWIQRNNYDIDINAARDNIKHSTKDNNNKWWYTIPGKKIYLKLK